MRFLDLFRQHDWVRTNDVRRRDEPLCNGLKRVEWYAREIATNVPDAERWVLTSYEIRDQHNTLRRVEP